MQNEIEFLSADRSDSTGSQVLAPVAAPERIAALDVIRGFALIGIFLMNIEFFNRPVGELGEGMPAGLSGLNWLASYGIAYLVAGKFWTIFSLLFGMGFALMLTRTEAKSQDFVKPYLRRLAALAIFGVLHHILIWPGDILFSYAIAATGLLLILFGKLRWILLAAIVIGALAAIPFLNPIGAVAMALVLFAGIAFLLRTDRTVIFFGRTMPIVSAVLCVFAVLAGMLSVAGLLIPAIKDLRFAFTSAILFLFLAYLFFRIGESKESRPWKVGSLLYSLLFISMIAGTSAEYFSVSNTSAKSEQATKVVSEKEKRKAESAAKRHRKEVEQQQKKLADNLLEVKVLTQGSYVDALQFRAKEFAENWAHVVIFSVLINCMFLIGFWFVRSGIMENTQDHLPMFKMLALYGLPLGIGLGIAGSFISTAQIHGFEGDPFYPATGMLYLGNLPACLGYVSLVVLMLNSTGKFSRIKILAPYGRMALTNYLSQSIICSAVFYSYGLGYYGMQRAHQVVFVLIVVILQLAFSHWWLSKFRYGPMEWLWRAVTYWKLPAFKI